MIHNMAAYCPTCLRVSCNCKQPKAPPAQQKDSDSFWSARMGLGEWTPEDKREVEERVKEVLEKRVPAAMRNED